MQFVVLQVSFFVVQAKVAAHESALVIYNVTLEEVEEEVEVAEVEEEEPVDAP